MTWYAAKGDPRWDKDELWTTMGHLYKGGMWFKKKSVLQVAGNYNANIAADGSDWRTNTKSMYWSPLNMLPSVADASDYFYLPAVGNCSDGKLTGVGSLGAYWSSSALPYDQAYVISFDDNLVAIGYNNKFCGFTIGVFE